MYPKKAMEKEMEGSLGYGKKHPAIPRYGKSEEKETYQNTGFENGARPTWRI